MERDSKQLTKRLIELRNAIKRKYKMFKEGTTESELLLEKQYKPLIKELKRSGEVKADIKAEEPSMASALKEDLGEDDDDFPPYLTSSSPNKTATVRTLQDDEVFGDEEEPPQVSSVLATPEGRLQASQYIDENFENPMTRKYMNKLMKDMGGSKRSKIDHIYGPRYEGSTLMVGSEPLQFDSIGSIRVADVSYAPTEGLYQLLFLRLPDEESYTSTDLTTYKDILLKSNAHKRGYTRDAQVNRNTSLKYRNVIAKLFPKDLYGGTGFKSVTERDIIYWDDPNELVDRLRILSMSTETGNNSHRNEMLNIVEELREAGIIKGSGNSRFRALLK